MPSKFNIKPKFCEYLELSNPELYNFDYKLLETAFSVQCSAMTTHAKNSYPHEAFTEEDAAECVLMAFKTRESNGKTSFLYKLLSEIYYELVLNESISSSVLAVIKNDWCISTAEDQVTLNSTDECMLSGALNIGHTP